MASAKQQATARSAGQESIEKLDANEKPDDREDGSGPDRLEREVIFEVLSNERRRLVLHYLRSHPDEQPVQLRDLVDQVAAWENDTTITELDSSDRKCVYTALKQSHLPKLDDVGVVDYDHLRGSVELTESADDVQPYLEFVPNGDIPWSKYYIGLSGVSAGLAALVWLGIPPFGGLGGFTVLAFVVVAFLCSAVVHYYRSMQSRLDPLDDDPVS